MLIDFFLWHMDLPGLFFQLHKYFISLCREQPLFDGLGQDWLFREPQEIPLVLVEQNLDSGIEVVYLMEEEVKVELLSTFILTLLILLHLVPFPITAGVLADKPVKQVPEEGDEVKVFRPE